MLETIKINEPMGLPRVKLEVVRVYDKYMNVYSGTISYQPCKGVWEHWDFVYNVNTDIIPILKSRGYDKGTVKLIKKLIDHYNAIIIEAERREMQ